MPPKRACDVCFKRKIQCTISSPDAPCEWCSHHQLDCTFNRESQKNPVNTKALATDVEALYRRIETLENALAEHNAQHQSQAGNSSSPSGSATSVTEPGESTQDATPLSLGGQSLSETYVSPPSSRSYPRQLHDAARYLGQNWYHKGIPILSKRGDKWLQDSAETYNALSNFNLIGSSRFSLGANAVEMSYDEVHELPERAVVKKTLESVLPFLPTLSLILDPSSFVETIRRAYSMSTTRHSASDVLAARACVLSALAFASHCQRSEEYSDPYKAQLRATKALRLLQEVVHSATVVNLQTALMLLMYQTVTGYWEDAIASHSTVCRLVCGLEGHFYHAPTPFSTAKTESDHEKNHVRMLFWLAYILDKDISLRSGQPPLLTEDYCDLRLPEGFANQYEYLLMIGNTSGARSPTTCNEDLTLCLPGDLGLSYIKEKACRLLYSPKAFTLDDCQLLQNVRQLDGDLEEWRQSIPLQLRPKLSLTSNCLTSPSQMGRLQRVRWMSLQLDYHYVVTVIHTMVRRCGAVYAEAGDLPHDLHMVFHSSHNLSLEASRSTLLILKKPTLEVLEGQGLWRIIFYAEVATMSLFINILIHPLDQQAHQDLEVLSAAVGMFHNLSARKVTEEEIEHVREMSNFVSELVRVANSAIWQARKEEKKKTVETPKSDETGK